mgnify:CR=1 FL=1
MKYPIGIQHFESLRQDGYVYVDKTRIIHDLVSNGRYYFLSRPRRFGKSLLISTLKAYFEGKRELFQGLAMEQLEQEWRVHPVLHLDLNIEKYASQESLDNILESNLVQWENLYGAEPSERSFSLRLAGIIRRAYEKTGERVVVLVDEYDKPLLQSISNKALQDEYRATLKPFYGVLKTMDECIKFALLTGVTKFSKVSVFSDLNNLNDISMDNRYTEICGISEKELHRYFQEDIQKMADKDGITYEEMSQRLRQNYDGYHFAPNTGGMYNPFSILNVLSRLQFGSYWFETGTPTYLVELMKEADLNPSALSGYEASASELDSVQIMVDNPIAVLYQSGYLTIKGYDARFKTYVLDYPNDEVKEGFVNFLVPYYTYSKSANNATIIGSFVKSLERGDVERFMELLQSFMADIPYELVRNLEVHYQNAIYIITKLMGLYVQAEYRTSRGRIDLLVGTDKYVYIIELKLDGSAEEALAQINEKDYALPFAVDGREIVKIGANITSETRNLERWVVES